MKPEGPAAIGRAQDPLPQASAPTARPRLQAAAAVLTVLSALLLCRPYFGIRHDARLYVGRAEADLGRAGMAHDLLFVHDGQSGFSIFGALFRPVVAWLGSGPAAMLFTGLGLVVWLAAAAFLMSRIFRGVRLWAALLALVALPGFYVAVLAYAEPFVTPRIFAEAAVCLSLACMLERQRIWAAALLLVAGALHPIMAAPGAAVFAAMLALKDRRWLFAIAAALVVGLGAALVGAPLLGRLLAPIDPAWLRTLTLRSAYLFPMRWALDSWLIVLRQTITLLIALSFLRGRPRELLLAVLLVGAAGVLATIAFPSLLVIQVQPWRAQWLVALFAAACLPFCLAQLWRAGAGSRAAAALLALAWGAPDPPLLALAACGLALGLRFVPLAERLPRAIWLAAWALAGLALSRKAVVGLAAALATGQQFGAHDLITRTLASTVVAILVGVCAVAALLAEDRVQRWTARPAAMAASALLVVVSALNWNAQDAWARGREAGANAAALRAQLPPGEIFWLGGDGRAGPWTDRPEWWSPQEGASSVFDRTLALEWARRYDILVRSGVVSPQIDMLEVAKKTRGKLTVGALDLICGARQGPDGIVAPTERVDAGARGLASGAWSAHVAPPQGLDRAEFLVFRCAPTNSVVSRGPSPPG